MRAQCRSAAQRLGDFELIAELLSNRDHISHVSGSPGSFVPSPSLDSATSRQETIRIGVTLNTDKEKKLQRMQRKHERKANRHSRESDDQNMLTHAAEIKLKREAWQENLIEPCNSDLQDTIANLPAESGFESVGWGRKTAMPKGTTRKECDGYEEVFVPMARRDGQKGADELVEIADLPDYARMVFRSIKRLNRLQSRVFDTAFYSNENLLVRLCESAASFCSVGESLCCHPGVRTDWCRQNQRRNAVHSSRNWSALCWRRAS